MKKLFVLAVALLISSAAWAASTNFTATASFAGNATFSFQLKNIQGDGNAQSLTWAEADAFNMTGTDSWVRAQQYAVVAATITKANAKVLMYTDNKTLYGENLPPNYNEWNGNVPVSTSTAFGGLVRNVNGQLPSDFAGTHRGYIPLLFSVNTQKNAAITSDGTQALVKDSADNPTRADRFLSDVSNGGYGAGYATIASLNGPTFGVDADGTTVWGSKAVTNNTAYMYFFGDFKNIIGGDTYTTTIHVEEMFQ